MITQRCYKCGQDKPETDYLVRKHGLGVTCRECRNKYNRPELLIKAAEYLSKGT